MRALSAVRAVLLLAVLAGAGARGSNAWAAARPPGPGRLPVGELVIGVWLPAGMDRARLEPADQDLLRDLGVNWVEWVQRGGADTLTVEALTMRFCGLAGLRMPAYYEPPGSAPTDKLRNWATRGRVAPADSQAVAERVRALHRRWAGQPGLGGYLVGHEDYRRELYPALAQVTRALARQDSALPAVSVGRLDHYADPAAFLAALMLDRGPANVFQHEHYVFRANVPPDGPRLSAQTEALAAGYSAVAAELAHRNGRWHAVVQAHAETRDGRLFYRRPTPAELSLQVGLALSRGASGVVYFLHSSGAERLPAADGRAGQERVYEGLVTAAGEPTPTYTAVRALNLRLRALSPVLAPLFYHGVLASRSLPAGQPVRAVDGKVELALFGDRTQPTHLLVANPSPRAAVRARLRLDAARVADAVTDLPLPSAEGQVTLELSPGDFALLHLEDDAGE